MKQLIALIMIAFLVPTTAAMATSPCKEDKAKFCKDAKAAGKKVNACLKEHSAELVPACKEFLDKPKEAKPGKEGKKGKKTEGKPAEGKPAEGNPAEEKPADAMKPAETKPAEPAPSESPPSPPASPGGAESK